MLVIVVVLVLMAVLLDPNPTLTSTTFLAFAAAGIVGTIGRRALFYARIKRVGTSRAEPIKAPMPLYATIFAVILFSKRVTGPHLVGIVLMVAGIALVLWEGTSSERANGERIPWYGLSLPLIAAIFFGLEPIFANVSPREGTSVAIDPVIKMIVAMTTFLLYLDWREWIPRTTDSPVIGVRGGRVRRSLKPGVLPCLLWGAGSARRVGVRRGDLSTHSSRRRSFTARSRRRTDSAADTPSSKPIRRSKESTTAVSESLISIP